MWRPSRWMAWLLVGHLGGGVVLSGCDSLQDLNGLSEKVLQAGSGTASKTTFRGVKPSRPAPAMHPVAIEDERYMGDIARQLGVTVDSILRDNGLTDNTLSPGMVLQIRASKDLVDSFIARREARKKAAVEVAAAKVRAKLKAQADERAAKRAARLALKRGHGRRPPVTAPAVAGRKPAGGRSTVKPGGPAAAKSPHPARAPQVARPTR
jgi:LysM repeat protein